MKEGTCPECGARILRGSSTGGSKGFADLDGTPHWKTCPAVSALKRRRLELELTQPEVSAALKEVEPHIDVGMVSRYEKGVCLPTNDQLAKLEEVLQAPRTVFYRVADLELLPGDKQKRGGARSRETENHADEKTGRATPASPADFSRSGEQLPVAQPPERDRPSRGAPRGPRRERHETRYRKCYRVPREFAESLPNDLLQVCGYSSWQSWHDAALKRLLGEYVARCKGIEVKKGAK